MSYCRFSTDNFHSDLYVYETAEGFVTHVASQRLKEEPPRGLEARSLFFAKAQWTPIGLPFDGARLVDGSLGELVARVESLAALGYQVPADLLDKLEGERKGEGVEQ